MKRQLIILGSAIALSIAYVQAADATESLVATGYAAPIEKLVGGERLSVDAQSLQSGIVKIDTDKQVIELTVTKESSCMGKLICPPNLNNTISMKLPIIKIERVECNVLEYTAEQNTTAGKELITVRDNSDYQCRNMMMMLPKTSVAVVKQTRSGDASAYFIAGQLQEIR